MTSMMEAPIGRRQPPMRRAGARCATLWRDTTTGGRTAARPGGTSVAKVTMPQLGESVAEGTIGKWMKQHG
jgi:hypothetical protein